MSVYNNVIFKDFNLTPRAKKAYADAFDLSKDLNHVNINNLHVLFGCLKNCSLEFRDFLSINGFLIHQDEVIDIIKESEKNDKNYFFCNKNSDPWNKDVLDVINEANKISHKLDQHYIGIEHIILSILKKSNHASQYISENIFEYDLFLNRLEKFVNGSFNPNDEKTTFIFEDPSVDLKNDLDFSEVIEESAILPDFVVSLNSLYVQGKLPDVYGRDEEVNLLIETVSKKNKSNAILTGLPGVGKTAIVECLVSRICNAEIPSNMLGMEILSVNMGSMLAGTQYRGQFEQKLKGILEIAKSSPHTILFFDEIHTIFGAGGNQEGSIDAANIIKPYLARGEIKCIGATTSEEYEKIFKKDGAMKRRFFEIKVDEPCKQKTKEILYNCKKKYELFHNVIYSKSIIDSIVDYSSNLITNKKFPDKAFDIIDQVGSRVKIKNSKPCESISKKHKDLIKCLSNTDSDLTNIKEKLSVYLKEIEALNTRSNDKPIRIKKNDVIEIISEHSNVSCDQIKSGNQNFISFGKRMKKEIFGQNPAVDSIEDLLSCAKAGLTDEDKPLASMFFVGPTSVGKTYAAKKIAKNFFGNEKAILQINMSELYDKTGISKLIGSNSGYVGYEEGGMLTKFVKENPNCVVLFDEVEKADPQILNILLHILDEGYVEDNKHEKISFSKSIVILTSNIGHQEVKKPSMGFIESNESEHDSYTKSVEKELKPELLARINKVIVFEELKDDNIRNIIGHELNKIKVKMLDSKKEITFSNEVIDLILSDLKSKNIHARGIKSYIREKIQVPLAKTIISDSKKSKLEIKKVDNKINIH